MVYPSDSDSESEPLELLSHRPVDSDSELVDDDSELAVDEDRVRDPRSDPEFDLDEIDTLDPELEETIFLDRWECLELWDASTRFRAWDCEVLVLPPSNETSSWVSLFLLLPTGFLFFDWLGLGCDRSPLIVTFENCTLRPMI